MRILAGIATAFAAVCIQANAGTFTLQHDFTGGADGASPQAPFIAGPHGTLYSTTAAGGGGPCFSALDVAGCGTVFALTPPAAGTGPWTETILYAFTTRADGVSPVAGPLRAPDPVQC